ncbi:hypothetical protein [Nitrosospira sp. Is2]|uniref:hypothetical protein n=1 Tax=Nitrosospira sp. Is2 TaxID=3080532 RepID=UPI00295309F7|nr:hypothetical protein [Nitrosospira sp. Is2]WON74045.1 hypothetical protein R5L00_00710 [Nitrosospira sp. Is2]
MKTFERRQFIVSNKQRLEKHSGQNFGKSTMGSRHRLDARFLNLCIALDIGAAVRVKKATSVPQDQQCGVEREEVSTQSMRARE